MRKRRERDKADTDKRKPASSTMLMEGRLTLTSGNVKDCQDGDGAILGDAPNRMAEESQRVIPS